MKILGLTVGRLFAAVIFGLLVAFTITYVTLPHLVEVPVQVIAPIPTPPPVVITEHPVQPNIVHPSATLSGVWNTSISEINKSTAQAFNILALMMFVISATMIIGIVSGVLGGGRE